MNKIEQASNLKVNITTLLDQTTTGTIYATASNQQVIALKVKSTKSGEQSFKFINTAFIKSIQVLPPFPSKKNGFSALKGQPILYHLPIEKLEQSLKKALEEVPDLPPHDVPRQERKSVASKVFRHLADAFGKSSVKWDNDKIVVNDRIRVSRPFTLGKNNVVSLVPNAKDDLTKVQTVIREFWLTLDNEKKGG